MRWFAAVFVVVAVALAACGDSNKPPLTPDTEHAVDVADAGPAPAPSAAPSAAPSK